MTNNLEGLELREATAKEAMGVTIALDRSCLSSDAWFTEALDVDGKRIAIYAIPKDRERERDGRPAVYWADIVDDLPPYESDWNAAGAVIEEMMRRGFCMGLSNGNGPTWKWDCEFMPTDTDGDKPCSLGQANAAPAAICKAALDVVRAIRASKGAKP